MLIDKADNVKIIRCHVSNCPRGIVVRDSTGVHSEDTILMGNEKGYDISRSRVTIKGGSIL